MLKQKAKGKSKQEICYNVGVTLIENGICAVWQDRKQRWQYHRAASPAELYHHFMQLFAGTKFECLFFIAAPAYLVWQTTKIYPHTLTEFEAYQQAQHIVAQEMPKDDDEVLTDYTFLENRLDIFAIKHDNVLFLAKQYVPLMITALDIMPRVLLRAFKHKKAQLNSQTLYLYYGEQEHYAIVHTAQKTYYTSKSDCSLEELYAHFQQQFDLTITHYEIYSEPQHKQLDLSFLPENATFNVLPVLKRGEFVALGCALWGNKPL